MQVTDIAVGRAGPVGRQTTPAHPTDYRLDRSYGTGQLGFDWAGPWIVGEDVYYVSAGKLYHVSLKELMDPDRRSFSETSGRQQR